MPVISCSISPIFFDVRLAAILDLTKIVPYEHLYFRCDGVVCTWNKRVGVDQSRLHIRLHAPSRRVMATVAPPSDQRKTDCVTFEYSNEISIGTITVCCYLLHVHNYTFI